MRSVFFILISFFPVILYSQTCVHLQLSDVISYEPRKLVNVTYGSIVARMGNKITPSQAVNSPRIQFDADPNKYYLLIMTDPDAPSRIAPTFREFIHWVVYDIKGSDILTGVTCFEYVAPGPPMGTGFHRYFFLVYPQKEKLNKICDPVPPTNFTARFNGRAENFALEIGVPRAEFINSFQSEDEG